MKRKKIGWVLSLMVLAIVLVVPSVSRSLAVDLDKECSLSFEMLPEYESDLASVNMKVDLYKVASAIEDPNFDSYSFEATSSFASLAPSLQNISAVDYSALSQQAAQIVVEENISPISVVSVTETASLEPGLYLTMPHRADVSLSDSIDRIMVGDGTYNVISFVNSPLYKYEFNPSLVALPSRMSEGSNNTSNTVDWQFDFEMLLKASRSYREDGSLIINKSVDQYGGSGQQMFVFEITVSPLEGDAYTRMESIVLEEGSTTASVTMDHIPAGATVSVREVYTGTNYIYVSGNGSETLDDADVVLTFDFENQLMENHKHGSSVNNRYTYSEDGRQVRQEGNE